MSHVGKGLKYCPSLHRCRQDQSRALLCWFIQFEGQRCSDAPSSQELCIDINPMKVIMTRKFDPQR
eukprot:scaffold107271_cov15-Tisochrysis_lutea.AAC.1